MVGLFLAPLVATVSPVVSTVAVQAVDGPESFMV